LKKNMLQNH